MDGDKERVLKKLIEVYGKQEAHYRNLISLTEELASLADSDSPPDAVAKLIADREACLKQIIELEKSIAAEKDIWQKEKGELPGDRDGLRALIDELRKLIERSLELDKKVESDIRTRLDSIKSDLDQLHRTRKAQKAYTGKDRRPPTGITRARA